MGSRVEGSLLWKVDLLYKALINWNLEFGIEGWGNNLSDSSVEISILLNIGWSIRIYILMTGRNVEQTKDVHMYIEEFILVEIWIHCCTNVEWRALEKYWFIYTRNKGLRNVRIALRSQLTSED